MNYFGVAALLVAVPLGAIVGLSGIAASQQQGRMPLRYFVAAAAVGVAFAFLLLRLFD